MGQCLLMAKLDVAKASQCKASLTHQLRGESFQGELSFKKAYFCMIYMEIVIISRAFEQIFESIDTSENMKYLVHASYLEIYNEEIRSR